MKTLRILLLHAMLLPMLGLVTPDRALAQRFSFQSLSPGTTLHGFRADALYLDDAGRPIGARFIHARTGFIFDLLEIQSVPQAFIWVNSFPTSDMGEPHTQEHLLLGKGNRGRAVANLQSMSLAESNAFTQQWRTCYHFNTGAGPEVYYRLFEAQMDALLHPDYTDEEIRREVRNFGVTESPNDGTLGLEEKGTVYNEMVSSFERSWSRLGRAMDTLIYGSNHPLSFVSGGLPAAIRRMQPSDIRKFHHDNYHLGNMGVVGSFPKEMSPDDVLKRTGQILDRIQPESETRGRIVRTEADLPAPRMAAPGTIRIAEYPQKNESQPGPLFFAWPATLKLVPRDYLLLGIFLDNLAGDAGTDLYRLFIDTKTRQMETGATGVFGWVSEDQGNPIYIGLNDLPPASMTEEKIIAIREKIREQLRRIASWSDGSPELIDFNNRLLNRIVETRRSLSKFVNSPPGFGFRNTGSAWMSQLDLLAKSGGFRRSITEREDLESIAKLVSEKKNFWKDALERWNLLQTVPYAAAARPSAQMLAQETAERKERIAAEVTRLKERYRAADEQEAVRRYREEYDSVSAQLERVASQDHSMRFMEHPPLTLDDQLEYKVSKLPGGVLMVASTFDNMTSATVGLALRLDDVHGSEMVYLSSLPALLTQVGVIDRGKPIAYQDMSEMLRKEILGLNAYFSTNGKTGRCELAVRGAGNSLEESQRAIEWMRLVLSAPDWRTENLPRIRDLVDQMLTGLRNTMQGREESWVNNPSNAYWLQDKPLLLATNSFLTRAHNVDRLRWLLKDAGSPADASAIGEYLTKLRQAGGAGRDDLKILLAAMEGDSAAMPKLPAALKGYLDLFNALPAGAKANAVDAAGDLDQNLPAIPDESLPIDWNYLCDQMRHDLLVPPSQALAELDALRSRLLNTRAARMFMIGSSGTQKQLGGKIDELLAILAKPSIDDRKTEVLPSGDLVKSRLRQRMPSAVDPVYVGLVNQNTGSGVFLNSAPLAGYGDTGREPLLQYLASKLYGGHGAHGVFMKTWGAGLAYSNGIGSNPSSGRESYYAERCPELPQTLKFVIGELQRARPDTSLAEYSIAQAFAEFRSASPYEARGEAIASDLADGQTPEAVSRFRSALLDLRRMPKLGDSLFSRMPGVYGKVLPGYNVRGKDVPGAVYFVIGPEKQFAAYEEYLKSVEGADTKLYRLYPRDFWMPFDAGSETGGGTGARMRGGEPGRE
jgi:Zn-dependent M16 (insulinase) family peptidase